MANVIPSSSNASIAAVVVLFRPDASVIARITEYPAFLEWVIVVDNTPDNDLSSYFSEIPGIYYVYQAENRGIAAALNVGAKQAMEKGFGWLLMLDQDSSLTKSTFCQIRERVEAIPNSDVAIFAPIQLSAVDGNKPATPPTTLLAPNLIMTSGSAIRLTMYLQCGPFEEQLFLDHVDHEYCLRLQRMHLRCLQDPTIILDHRLGISLTVKFLFRHISLISHAPFRSYYFFRNGLYVAKKYWRPNPIFSLWLLSQFSRRLLKLVLFEDQKIIRIKMIARGILDFCRSKFGPGHLHWNDFP